MKKLSLALTELKVESFDTFVPEERRGTVRGNLGCVTFSCKGTCGAQPASDLADANPWAITATACPQCCV